MNVNVTLRREVRPGDVGLVREIVTSSGFFSPAEIEIAEELVTEALERGQMISGYYFIFADLDGRTAAYACYGPDDFRPRKFHLYWIAAHEDFRRHGLGSLLIRAAEQEAKTAGAEIVAVETSSREQYAPSRAFYEKHGYVNTEVRRDHYGPGDHMLIYVKVLGAPEAAAAGQGRPSRTHADI